MVDVSYQRRMAARILKCGLHRVWIDPDQVDEVSEAVTRGDIRRLISYRVIQVRQKRGVSHGRIRQTMAQRAKGRRKGPGSRKGRKFARTPRKRRWIQTIRPLREELRTLREEGKLDPTTYRVYYRKARGNMFRSRADLLVRLEAAGVLAKGEAKEKESAKQRAKREREERQAKAQAARARVREKAAAARAKREAEMAEKKVEMAPEAPKADQDEEAEEAPKEEEPITETPEEEAPETPKEKGDEEAESPEEKEQDAPADEEEE
jgi:large subunit ribosomal protein L19e